MTVRLRIVHRSEYRYEQPVLASYNEARVTPMATPWQVPLESVLEVPQATWRYRYFDYWGSQVGVAEAYGPHTELVFEARSMVEIDSRRRPAPQQGPTWDELRSASGYDALSEYLAQTTSTQPPAELAATAAELAVTASPRDAAIAVCSHVHDTLTYRPGATGVHTAAAEAWDARSGVCQDYAHLVVGALRGIGLPARYVSGYLHPRADAEVGETLTGESHAWVEWWQGTWVGFDPTNATEPTDRHVIVARARDYLDVPPIKGLLAGPATGSTLAVSVATTRLA